ncbi:unnamed protein product [Notodromas monacha]|uniref:Protein kinase domain-containing protein n=1 Tax=Notodromas monacha TaxID=399045 RepID=A0A7R9BNA5_9CRUS|nr:unnamed protein product [Notodromas monacha]CAG0917138.1 unnamed protein product [Notodromas monacha]
MQSLQRAFGIITKIDEKDVSISKTVLGSGGFGCVNPGKWKNREVAIKCIRVSGNFRQDAALKNEASLIFRCDHVNIIKMHGLINFQDGRLGIVMELADKGPLSRKLMRELSKGDGAAARRFSKGIINGLQYLHHRRIVHRDLKPDNILCFGELPSPKITDFGISKVKKIQNSDGDDRKVAVQ